MASLIPVIRGKLGSTEYFVGTMKGKELVERLTIPKELEGWEDISIEEKYQREIDFNRVKKYIAPYLANDPDRFFGSLIVAVINPEGINFESINDVGKNLPGLYKSTAEGIGFLTLSGGEVLVPLDGQHRLKAVKYAITGKDDSGVDIPDITSTNQLAQEDVTVILVPYEKEKARKIFNKVNRYAKPTSKAQNLITDDDDVIAVITRDIADKIIGSRLVNFQSNTLSKQAEEFTTLSMLYDSVEHILLMKGHKFDKSTRPEKAKEKLFQQEVENVWVTLVQKIDLFVAALHDKSEGGDDRRREIRHDFILGKPIGQLCLVRAYLRLQASKTDKGANYSDDEICSRLNKIDWSLDSPKWRGILTIGDKMASGKTAQSLGGDFIAYLAGEHLAEDKLNDLLNRIKTSFTKEEQESIVLPPREVS
ncbi:DNA sulfur modification protein DndB [Nitrosomonas nitrosa]|uniref:DNA sulfur modification protein DndB n=1 Tax=Nitrosomonas nitrosa TaxID=52442 RepID=UPI0023F98E7C|nr:DNA sulfur modification protein DndB [Nitrosomonas nitrosa]MCO6433066.1 DGQHR domain-containing protein [Nitrosomonas nitrosa]